MIFKLSRNGIYCADSMYMPRFAKVLIVSSS